MNLYKEMDKKVVSFLVKYGSLPAFKDSDQDKIQEAEDKLKDKLRRTQTGLESAFIDKLQSEGIIPNSPDSQSEFIDAVMSEDLDKMRDVIADGNVDGAKIGRQITFDLAQEQGMDINFHDFDKKVLDDFRKKAYEFSKETIDNIKGGFRGTLAQAYEDGMGIDEATDLLKHDFANLRESRIQTIARTEINSSQSKGNNQTLSDLDIPYKQWITAEDDRVRGENPEDEYDHVNMHGEVVRIDETFSNGLLYPGDSSGDPGNVINCRCTQRPYIPKPNEDISSTPYYP